MKDNCTTFSSGKSLMVMNPPYHRKRYISFIDEAINNAVKQKGQLVVIMPASILIDFNPNARGTKEYERIKSRMKHHVSKVVIENLNKDFNTRMHELFAIVHLDYRTRYDNIDYVCCGYHRIVNTLNDCTLVENTALASSIISKVAGYCDMMRNHISQKIIEGDCHVPYGEILSSPVSNPSMINNSSCFVDGIFYTYWEGCLHHTCQKPIWTIEKGMSYNHFVHGTNEQMMNWILFIKKNKLPKFLSICYNIAQHNRVKNIMPFLVDKKYTDMEIYELFNFTNQEIELIDKTILQYNQHSPWFVRMMTGNRNIVTQDCKTNDLILPKCLKETIMQSAA